MTFSEEYDPLNPPNVPELTLPEGCRASVVQFAVEYEVADSGLESGVGKRIRCGERELRDDFPRPKLNGEQLEAQIAAMCLGCPNFKAS